MSSRYKILFSTTLALLALVCFDATRSDANGDDTAFFSDFDGDGTIGFGDFVKFAGVFGARHGDEKYDSIYDLNGDGEIGFSDFVIFAQNFGKDTPAPDFTEPQIYNDNIFILPVSEDLTSGYPPLHVYARVFYEHFEDEFDFLIFVRNLVRGTDHVDVNVNHSLLTVKNEVQGIGLPIFSRAHSWGSSEKLQGRILLVWIEFSELVWGEEWRLFKDGPILHELMHRWANFIKQTSYGAHWGFSSAYGVVGGFDLTNLKELGDGQYIAGSWSVAGPNSPDHFSPIELYLAGFIPPEEVPDLWVGENGKFLRDDNGNRIWTDSGPIFTTSQFKIYTIEDIIAEHGPRIPDHTQSQKDFRAAVILLTDEKHPAKLQVLKKLSDDVSWFSYDGDLGTDLHLGIERYNFHKATGGRGAITMDGLSQFKRNAGAP